MKRLTLLATYLAIGATAFIYGLPAGSKVLGPSTTYNVGAVRGTPTVVLRTSKGLYRCRLNTPGRIITKQGFGCDAI